MRCSSWLLAGGELLALVWLLWLLAAWWRARALIRELRQYFERLNDHGD